MFGLFKKIPSVSTSDYQKETNKSGTVLLDVREPQEFQAGHIPGAINVPVRKVQNYRVPKNTETVYVICQSGMRSKQAAKILDKKDIPVVNIRGGMSAWRGTTKGGKY